MTPKKLDTITTKPTNGDNYDAKCNIIFIKLTTDVNRQEMPPHMLRVYKSTISMCIMTNKITNYLSKSIYLYIYILGMYHHYNSLSLSLALSVTHFSNPNQSIVSLAVPFATLSSPRYSSQTFYSKSPSSHY